MNTLPALKPHHIRAVKKALNILLADHADGYTESGGWCAGTQVRGWQVADECVELGFFELSLDSKKTDLNSRRYRILPKGIEQLIKIGDKLNLKDGRSGILRGFSSDPRDYRFRIAIDGVEEWVHLTALDIVPITAQQPVLNQPATNYIGTLTAPDLGKSPYTRVEIPADHEVPETAAPATYFDHPSPSEAAEGEGFTRAIIEAVSADDDTEERIDIHYFCEPIGTSQQRTAAKFELERLMNEEDYLIIFEQVLIVDGKLHHVARLERETDSAAPQPLAQPVDDMLPELV